MIQEEKELLLRDLCARLPYGVRCIVDGLDDCTLMPSDIEEERDIKPYLRPLSSMTEEEDTEFQFMPYDSNAKSAIKEIDWLNAHHFDYRGLIEKSLALEAPEGMYK